MSNPSAPNRRANLADSSINVFPQRDSSSANKDFELGQLHNAGNPAWGRDQHVHSMQMLRITVTKNDLHRGAMLT